MDMMKIMTSKGVWYRRSESIRQGMPLRFTLVILRGSPKTSLEGTGDGDIKFPLQKNEWKGMYTVHIKK